MFFLLYPVHNIIYGKKSRIQFLWDQNNLHGVTLLVQGAWNQKVARTNDVFIVNKLCETPWSVDIMEKIE